MLIFRAGIYKMLVRIANKEDPVVRLLLRKLSDLGPPCLSRPFWQAFILVFEILEHLP